MAVCYICGKRTRAGRSQQHRRGVAGKRWKKRAQSTLRLFRPNLQKITITENGKKHQVTMCTRCIKRRKKNASSL